MSKPWFRFPKGAKSHKGKDTSPLATSTKKNTSQTSSQSSQKLKQPSLSKYFASPSRHGRMARGGHGLPKVSPVPAMPYPSLPCGWATTETALQPFLAWPTHRAGGLRSSSTPLDNPRRTPMRPGERSGHFQTLMRGAQRKDATPRNNRKIPKTICKNSNSLTM
jgi:hypothetical protein